LIISCSTDINISKTNDSLVSFDTLNISHYELFDLSLGYNDITPCGGTSIGRSLYPNIQEHDLDWPKLFMNIDKDKFRQENEYFFSKKDSIARVILRNWRWPYQENTKGLTALFNSKKKQKRFIAKFESIKYALNAKYGVPDSINSYSNTSPRFYRLGYKWTKENGVKAYLFVTGNDSNSYNEIQLVTYLE